MDYQVIWSPLARDDLRSITRALAARDPDAAQRIGFAIIDATKRLSLLPRHGRKVPEFGWDTLRELVFRRYRIIYRLNDEKRSLEIVRVWASARGHPVIP